jgi:hypothetical protein
LHVIFFGANLGGIRSRAARCTAAKRSLQDDEELLLMELERIKKERAEEAEEKVHPGLHGNLGNDRAALDTRMGHHGACIAWLLL